jgi:hypothetical protein
MRSRLNTYAFFASAALCLGILGVWAYSLISIVGVIHYKPRGEVDIYANKGRLEVDTSTAKPEMSRDLYPEALLGWTAGASWAVDRPLPSARWPVHSDRRLLGLVYQAGDTFWVLRVPLLPIAVLPMWVAAWTGFKWRAARPKRGPAFDSGKPKTSGAEEESPSPSQQHRSAFRPAA